MAGCDSISLPKIHLRLQQKLYITPCYRFGNDVDARPMAQRALTPQGAEVRERK
jgi:hypothetical protein